MKNYNFTEEERQEIIKYGVERAKVRILFFGFVVLVGITFDILFEGLLFWFSFCSIRRYAGGYHANTQAKCSVISGVVIVLVFMLLKFVSISLPVGMLLLGGAYLIIMVLSPVESKNRILDKADKIRFRKKTHRTSSVLLVAIGLIYWTGNEHIIWPIMIAYIVVAISLIGGVCKNGISSSAFSISNNNRE